MSFGFGLGFPKAALFSGANAPSLSLQFIGAETLDPRVTFTRASSATYFNSAGVLQRATYNLLTYSEQFDNAAWAKNRVTVSADSTTAPDGALTADKVIATAVNGSHNAAVAVSVTSGVAYTFSVYAKAGEYGFAGLLFAAAGFGSDTVDVFNLSTGAVSINASGTASIVSVGNGWYRCSSTRTASTTASSTFQIRALNSAAGSDYTGDGTSGIFIWGAQLEAASTAGPYYATTNAANGAPRFDYDPTTLAARGLLIEEQRTNSIRNNTMQGAVAGTPGTAPTNWLISGLAGLTQQIVGTGTESGINYIDVKVSGTTSSALFYVIRPESAVVVAAANGQTWTSSHYVRLVGGSLANLTRINNVIQYSDAVGTPLTYGIGDIVPTGAALNTQRFARTTTASNASTAFVVGYLQLEANSGAAIDITLRIGLPQLEQGAFATSVIPTTTAAATRLADSAVMTGSNFSPWYNQSEGTFFGEVTFGYVPSASQFPSLLAASDGTSAESHQIYWTATNAAVYEIRDGGVQQAAMTRTDASPLKWVGAYKLNDCALVVDGGTPGTDSAATMPTPDRLYVGANAVGAQFVNGWLRSIRYYPTRLPNATLQALTA